MNNARSIVILSMVGTGVIVTVGDAHEGKFPPPPSSFIALGFIYLVLAGLSDSSPQIAKPFAALVLIGTLITKGPAALAAISSKVSSGNATSNAGINPAQTLLGSSPRRRATAPLGHPPKKG